MHEAMLLLDAVPMRHMDFSAPVLDDRQRRPNQVHGILFVETDRDTFGEVGIGRTGHNTFGMIACLQ